MTPSRWYRVREAVTGFGIGRALVVLLILILAAGLAFSRWQLHRARNESEGLALRADSLEAAGDVTRRAMLSASDAVKILGDSLQAVERRGVQLSSGVKPDAFDRATGRTTVVRGGITVSPGTITTTATSTPVSRSTDSLDVRIGIFHVDSSGARSGPRYVADARVSLPPPPQLGRLELGVRLEPIALAPRIQCGAPVNGIRPATMAVVAPVGISVDIAPLELNARVCNEDFGRPKGWRVPIGWVGAAAAVGFVAGVLVAH